MNIINLNQRWQLATKSVTENSRGRMFMKDYELEKATGAIVQLLLTNKMSEAMNLTNEELANELSNKTGLKVYYLKSV